MDERALLEDHPEEVMPAHPLSADDAVTLEHAETPRRYEIRIRRQLGMTLLEAFGDLQAEIVDGDTVLRGTLPDAAALHGVLAEIEALGLELVEVRRLQERPDGRGPRSSA